MKEYPWGKGTPVWMRDAALNDSDKSFTVPAGKVWDVSFIYATLTATATVGNRILKVLITDGTNTLYDTRTASATAASQIGKLWLMMGMSYVTRAPDANVGNSDSLPRPCVLPAGYVIRVYDSAAIDAAADDLNVTIHYVEYDA